MFEKNRLLGKKLLATGNGRCNIHNVNATFKNYHSSTFDKNSLVKIINVLPFSDFEKMMREFGLLLEALDDGRVYPLSNSAKSILEIFLSFLENKDFFLENEVLEIIPQKDSYFLKTSQGDFSFKCVVLACGSEASFKLGGSDKGIRIAKNLGLECIDTYPSLVPLCGEFALKNISGIKINAKLVLKEKRDEVFGDVLFTDYGISGFGVLDISQKVKKDSILYIDFLPNLDSNFLENLLVKIIKQYPQKSLKEVLAGILHPKLARAFEESLKIYTLNTKEIKRVIFALKNMEFQVSGTKGFDFAEVSGGGVSAKEIDANTMECVRYKNLYLLGEMLDVVGDRGGYNLAFAWASAFVCFRYLKSLSL